MKNISSFEELNISEDILKSLKNMGFKNPSPVQQEAIPPALEGKNIIVKSQTGTGKTAAYGIPVLEKIELEEKLVQVVVLTPTRELAVQVSKEIDNLGKFKRIRSTAIYGGQPIDLQTRVLKQRVHIIVSTPGRILDHIGRGNIDLSKVNTVIIDEADQMFDMGFINDVEAIVDKTPSNRQMMLFSATISEKVERITEKYMKDAVKISITPEEVTGEKIDEKYYMMDEKFKFTSLCRILCSEEVDSAIIFCETKANVGMLSSKMRRKGFEAYELHGDLTQEERLDTINKFKQGEFNLLVATDVAARGIDVDDVTHVINYDIPLYTDSYVHRIGRTARAGKAGKAITLVTPNQLRFLESIQEFIGHNIPQGEIPTEEVTTESIKKFNLRLKSIKIKKKEKKADVGSEITTLYIKAGKKNKIRPGDLVGAILGATGLTSDIIGVIDIYDHYTYVDIMGGHGNEVLEKLKEGTIKGKKLKIEKAKR
ncbi:DEAD/DEAH box helicase [Clostridium magnum]|uniref:ATP-dependent RNA helicase CshA n=1 Tax=Clostridium magnum DSM 2767 TaxID=1121326 RepID=A0A162T1T1_9CLOT|nr:DEAD/DEAH box helicase [Clostridium magnum]KZL92141.1 ATP-dependent RNA helicase DbpA [Clostridium magnum DSM 2767]SHH20712.1 ATP-dependent RNA helicase DbpA [Clostridium magnum DSM 2767]